MARQYSNLAGDTTLTGSISNVATTIVVASATGLPVTFPYTLILEPEQPSQEIVTVTNAAGTSLTVLRGQDTTAGVSHGTGSVVRHGHTARDFKEPQDHIDATAAHGATGAVMGTTNSQTVSNKTVSAATNTLNGFTASRFVTSDGTGRAVASQTKAIPAGVVVGTTDSQTLTNKIIDTPVFAGVGWTDVAIKSSDTARATTTVFAIDPHLSLTLPSFGTYLVETCLFLNPGSDTPDMNCRFSVGNMVRYSIRNVSPHPLATTANATGDWVVQVGTTSPTASVGVATDDTLNLGGGQQMVLVLGGAATLNFEWAQVTSSAASTRLLTDSFMRATRIA